jgi:hypothetical protein
LAPLTQSQIDAASKFWAELAQLKDAFPECHNAIRVKAIVLSTLYGTNIIAIYRVGEFLERLLKETRTALSRISGLVISSHKSSP